MPPRVELLVEEMYLEVLPIVAQEARRAGCREDDALSVAGVLFMAMLRDQLLGPERFRRYFQKSLRHALLREKSRLAREVPVDPLVILAQVQPDGQPVRDAEAALWCRQLADAAGLTPGERRALEQALDGALDNCRSGADRRLLSRARKKLRRVLEGTRGGDG